MTAQFSILKKYHLNQMDKFIFLSADSRRKIPTQSQQMELPSYPQSWIWPQIDLTITPQLRYKLGAHSATKFSQWQNWLHFQWRLGKNNHLFIWQKFNIFWLSWAWMKNIKVVHNILHKIKAGLWKIFRLQFLYAKRKIYST